MPLVAGLLLLAELLLMKSLLLAEGLPGLQLLLFWFLMLQEVLLLPLLGLNATGTTVHAWQLLAELLACGAALAAAGRAALANDRAAVAASGGCNCWLLS